MTTAIKRPDFPSWASNFYASPLEWKGLRYADVESAFQSAKTINLAARRAFALPNMPGPGRAKQMGRALPLREDWEAVKDDVMLEILRAKFQDPNLARYLTGWSEPLIEWTSWHDNWWGVCICGRAECHGGRNRLGSLLVQVRLELRNQVKPLKGHQVPLEALATDGSPIDLHEDMEAGRGDAAWIRYFAGDA